jgi:hypothetical protein
MNNSYSEFLTRLERNKTRHLICGRCCLLKYSHLTPLRFFFLPLRICVCCCETYSHSPLKYKSAIRKRHYPCCFINYFNYSSFYTSFELSSWYSQAMIKGKRVLVTGRGGPQSCERSRLLYFLENRLTDGSEVVSLTRRSPLIPKKILGTHFSQSLSRPQGYTAVGRIR